MNDNKKMTAPYVSAATECEQPSPKKTESIIPNHQQQSNLQATKTLKNQEISLLQTVTMTELYDTTYTQRIPLIDGFLYSGTYLFVGAPKVGKSFFMAQLGYHISKGIPLWEQPIRQGTVLYLALEDDYARLQSRLSAMFGVEGNDDFHFATRAETLENGLERQLNDFVENHGNVRVIVIDTLQKIREAGGEKFGYASDYSIVTKLKEFGDRHGLCILIVHHTRKMEATDSFEMISGTNGLLGAADGAFLMQKERRTDNRAMLELVGRDQQEQRRYLRFNRETLCWELESIETELWLEPPDPLLEKIARLFIDGKSVWKGTASDLLEQLEDVELQPNVLTRKLNILSGKLLNDYGIRYEARREHEGRIIRLERVNG